MNGGVFSIDHRAHRETQALLPWYAAEQLSAAEAGSVARHLQDCAQCRRDLARERALLAASGANAADTDLPALDMEGALARLLPQLGAQEPAHQMGQMGQPGTGVAAPAAAATATATATAPALTTQPWWRRPAANQQSWLRWALAGQCVLIAGLLVLLVRPGEPATYHALSSGAATAPASGNLVVMFQPTTTERDFRRILQSHGARVVDGPTVTDAYLLHVAPESRQQALDALRANPAIKLAEALDDGSAP
ncbi:MAG: zf-HC2 domain-containing protein [Duganella sp.]